MAFSSTVVFQGSQLAIFNIIASADADTGGTVNHGLTLPGGVALPVAPMVPIITPLLQASAGLSLWAVTGKTATQITLTKSTAVGSGNAGAQLLLVVLAPNTLIQ